ncbi:TolC family protein [Legionella maioricensis]|uniref:TolC family protein n=1 Tax=Legionella maioricensis TaxID=2896528 RepID=A0A9X2D4F0_9GAMM|nr:TolC family protein [Legionella maioricensis]MCL9685317.1 TolC family protein [Legionella maioricensis]MCL9688572.1 TolC family protein [Legionella maioricensis]
MRGKYCFIALLIIINALSHQTYANRVLTFQQALNIAYQNNPSIQAQQTIIEQAKGQLIQSKLYPNPSMAIQAENIGLPSTLESGYTGTETTISVTQPIPLGKRLFYQGMAAKMEHLAARLKLEATRSSLYIDVGQAYIEALYVQYWTKATKRLVRVNEDIVASIKKRLDIGANSEVDLNLAELALDEAIIVFDRARRNEFKKKITLANLIGMPHLKNSLLNEEGLTHNLNKWSTIKTKVANSNLIKAQMALIKAMNSQITSAQKQVWPDLNLQLGFRHFQLFNEKALVLSANAPIPLYNQNQGNIYTAQAKRNETIKNLHQLKLNLDTTLYEAYLDGLQNKEEAQKVAQRMLPNAKKTVELAKEGFQQGRYTYLILSNAMLNLSREEEHYTRAHADYHKALIKIQGLLMSGK